jgi:ABC-2 type transport system ATP-binding protein
MLEVEYLCHRVALINKGKIVAQGSPDTLKIEYGKKNLEEVFMELTQHE